MGAPTVGWRSFVFLIARTYSHVKPVLNQQLLKSQIWKTVKKSKINLLQITVIAMRKKEKLWKRRRRWRRMTRKRRKSVIKRTALQKKLKKLKSRQERRKIRREGSTLRKSPKLR